MHSEGVISQILTPTGPVWRTARADNYHTRAVEMTLGEPVLVALPYSLFSYTL